MDPLIIGQEAVGLVRDVFDIEAQAMVELAFEQLLKQKKWHTLHVTQCHVSNISLIKLSEYCGVFERKKGVMKEDHEKIEKKNILYEEKNKIWH